MSRLKLIRGVSAACAGTTAKRSAHPTDAIRAYRPNVKEDKETRKTGDKKKPSRLRRRIGNRFTGRNDILISNSGS